MATVDLGKIRFNWQGAYNNSTAYVVNDVVSSGGNSYICILASTGNAVSNGTYWSLMAQAGTNGTNGSNGADGTDVGTVITTQGDVLYRDGSGLQRLGAGSSGQFLKTQGTGANPVWADAGGGGAWNVITSTQASSSASVDFTSITNTYATYAVVISQAIPVTDNTTLVCRVGDSSGFDSATGDYDFHTTSCRSNSSSYSAYAGGNDPEIVLSTHNFVGNGTDEGWGGIVYIHNPINASTLMKISSKGITTNSAVVDFNICAGLRTTAITCDRIQFFFLSGNISSGRFTLYGLAHS